MSDGKGPRLTSVPGGLGPSGGASPKRAKVSAHSPTSKLPAPPATPPPLPDGVEAVDATPPLSEDVPPSLTTTAEFAAIHPMVKRQFGRYELLMQMGSGGMAALYLARIRGPQKFEKLLAVKKIHEHLLVDQDFVSMFRDEARIAALIHHPNVVTTFDLGAIDGSYFIAMEYVHGQTVRDIVNACSRREEPLDWAHAVRVAAEVAKGLHAAHTLRSHSGESLDVIHRDVSPQNILVSYDGHVKLVDFGIAYAAERLSHTGAGKLKGKVSYMTPEQVVGAPVDGRTDIFSLGIVLFEMLTMRRLFKEENEASTILKVRAARIPPLAHHCPRCPPELSDILRKALAREPDDRFETAEAFADALEELLVATGRRVGRKDLSGLMEDLFLERKRIKDRMRRRALVNTTDTPIQGIEAVDDGTESLIIDRMSTASAEASFPQQGSNRLLLGVLLGVTFVLAVAVSWLLLRPAPKKGPADRQGQTRPASAVNMTPPRRVVVPREAPMRRRPATAPSVMLTIRIRPDSAKATIVFRGETQRGTIFQAALPASSNREEVTITAPGFQRRVVPIVLSQALTLPVELIAEGDTKIASKKRRKRSGHKRRKKPRRRPMSMLLDL